MNAHGVLWGTKATKLRLHKLYRICFWFGVGPEAFVCTACLGPVLWWQRWAWQVCLVQASRLGAFSKSWSNMIKPFHIRGILIRYQRWSKNVPQHDKGNMERGAWKACFVQSSKCRTTLVCLSSQNVIFFVVTVLPVVILYPWTLHAACWF